MALLTACNERSLGDRGAERPVTILSYDFATQKAKTKSRGNLQNSFHDTQLAAGQPKRIRIMIDHAAFQGSSPHTEIPRPAFAPDASIHKDASCHSRFCPHLANLILAAALLRPTLSAQVAIQNPPPAVAAGMAMQDPSGEVVAAGFQSHLGLKAETWSVFTQLTYIEQWHYGFPVAYSGPESLSNKSDAEHTFSYSLFVDRTLWRGTELVYNPEIFQGHGLSQTLGVAGFPNGEAVKSGFANLRYNTSRLFVRQVFGLGGETEKLERDLNQEAQTVDVNRVTVSIGKFAANDFFDGNAYTHDPRTQFMNWALWESAAWDYPADVVGFTAGGVVEWNTQQGTLRYGIFLEPDLPNSPKFDMHLAKAYGQILQYDLRYSISGHAGTVRPFVYLNRTFAGVFAPATAAAFATGNPADASTTRRYGFKVGGGVSWDQVLMTDLGAFVRLSFNDGRTEDWAFTQIDRSVAAGLSLKGERWHRPDDTFGLAVAVNGISSEQRAYLAAGGTGLIIGDGALNYRMEQILEAYYAFHALRWLQFSFDYQYIRNPAYNADRGPVSVFAVRGHVQL